MLEIKDLFAGYNGKDVIRNINFKIKRGDSLCILGPNGSGKSTLLKSIARLIDYRGIVLIENQNIAAIPRKELAKKIALLSQNSHPAGAMQLYFPYTVYDTVSMGRYAHFRGFLKDLSGEDKEIINHILNKLDIWDIKDRVINELSGGTLQRVFLARTLAQTPDIILLDEPANHLDLKHQIELLNFLKTWANENNKILIGVFHDLNLAWRFSNTAIVLENGKIAVYGQIENVLKSDVINPVFGIDIQSFMQESFNIWHRI